MNEFNNFDDTFSKEVWERGKKYGIKVVPVGGLIRDFLLNRDFSDYDFILLSNNENDGKIKRFIDDFASFYGLKIVKPSKFETFKLVSKKLRVDFSVLPEENLEKDLLSRDLTINSIAYFFETKEFFDPSDGMADLKNKVLKTFKEENFKKDPLRILRLFRFYAYFKDFSIEENTKNYAFENAPMLQSVAKERIREEIEKIFVCDFGYGAVKEMFYPVLAEIFPSLSKIKNIPQNGYHHLDVFNHTLEVLKYCFDLKSIARLFPFFEFKFGDNDKLVLRLAALFHDVGKSETLSYTEKGITTFRNHQFVSGTIVLKELDFFPKSIVERVYYLVRRHMLFLNFMINGYSEKSFRKLINMMREDAVLLVVLFLADKNAARGSLSEGNFEKALKIAEDFLRFYQKEKDGIINLPKLVSGHEVIEILEISPSKKVGKVLNLIMEKQLENPEFSREDALKLIYSLKSEKHRDKAKEIKSEG